MYNLGIHSPYLCRTSAGLPFMRSVRKKAGRMPIGSVVCDCLSKSPHSRVSDPW